MTLSPRVTWPSAAITTLCPLRTQITVVERMRRVRDFSGVAALEPAVAVEPCNTDERIDICYQVYRRGNVAEWGPTPYARLPNPHGCDILHRVPLLGVGASP